jgi:hypothetical protein
MTLRVSNAFMILLALFLGACASVPLKTAWKLRKLTPETLLEIEPADVRAAVELDRRIDLDVSRTSLSVTFVAKEGTDKQLAIPLRSLATGDRVAPELPEAPPGRYWTILELTTEGRDRMVEVQEIARDHLDEYSGMTFQIEAGFGDEVSPEVVSAYPVQFWVLLTPEMGYVKLFDARLETGEL